MTASALRKRRRARQAVGRGTRVELNKTEQPLAGVVIGYESNSIVGDRPTIRSTSPTR